MMKRIGLITLERDETVFGLVVGVVWERDPFSGVIVLIGHWIIRIGVEIE